MLVKTGIVVGRLTGSAKRQRFGHLEVQASGPGRSDQFAIPGQGSRGIFNRQFERDVEGRRLAQGYFSNTVQRFGQQSADITAVPRIRRAVKTMFDNDLGHDCKS